MTFYDNFMLTFSTDILQQFTPAGRFMIPGGLDHVIKNYLIIILDEITPKAKSLF
jgi:hypothetical protein